MIELREGGGGGRKLRWRNFQKKGEEGQDDGLFLNGSPIRHGEELLYMSIFIYVNHNMSSILLHGVKLGTMENLMHVK